MDIAYFAHILFSCRDFNTGILSYESSSLSKFATFDISGNVITVPAAIARIALRRKSEGYDTIVWPIVEHPGSSNFTRRNANTIMEDLSHESLNFQKVITSKGNSYYGTKGMILDEQFRPLVIAMLELAEETRVIEGGNYTGFFPKKAKLCLDYKVFSSDNILEKTILKQVIPYYANEEIVPYNFNHYAYSCSDPLRVEIVIQSLDSIITTTASPTVNTTKESIISLLQNVQL